MSQSLTIKTMPINERPYEKLERLGPSVLSDAELLAIIIKSGTFNERSTDVALRVIDCHENGLIGLHYLTIKELMTIKGIGRVKAIQLKALAEISTRIARTTKEKRVNVNSPSTVADLYMEDMRHLDKEQLRVVLLDTKNSIIEDRVLSVGTVNASLVHPREVFIYALKTDAVNILLLHNHPSGDPKPSNEDILITQRLVEAGKIVGIPLVDHIIIGDRNYSSLRQMGYLKN